MLARRTLLLAVILAALPLRAQEAVRPMDPGANPGFEVATIKPGNPETPGKDFAFVGHHVWAKNYNVNDMLALAYGLHPHQVLNAPTWFGGALYDIDGIPDTPGIPNQAQKDLMLQKLLTDRFQLRFHYEQRTLAVYAITIAPGGPRLTASDADDDVPSNYRFKNGLHGVRITNMSLADFAMWFQKTVMDKPVIDRSGLTSRYTFEMEWTPNDSQFQQLRSAGSYPAPDRDDPRAPPGLFTAIQQQLGLKLEPRKAPVNVMVIDHAERPSPN